MSSEYMTDINKIAEVFDGPHATPKKIDRGPYFLSISSLENGQLDLSKSAHLSEDEFKKWTRRVTPTEGDLLFSYETRLGEAALMPKNITACLGRRMGLLRPIREKVIPDYLLYAYMSPEFQRTITSRTINGCTVNRIALKDLPNFPIRIPPLPEQRTVVAMLKSIDNKITLNRQINQTLESMAQAVFKSWFVDFDPVKAKIAALESGEDAEGVTRAAMRAISGKTDDELDKMEGGRVGDYAQLKTTAGLLPSAMQETELGEVPEGWEFSSIDAEFNTTMGQSPPGNTYNENGDGAPFFQGRRDFGWRYPEDRVYCTQPKRMAKKGDTLLSVRAPVGDINKAISDCCIGRGIASLRHKSGCEAYTYYTMMDLSRKFNSFDSEGTVFGSINQKDLKALKIIKPSNSLIEVFTHIAGTLDQQILNSDDQIRVLSKLRDTLLPKLLLGELSVDTL